jgi:hypothetical protein
MILEQYRRLCGLSTPINPLTPYEIFANLRRTLPADTTTQLTKETAFMKVVIYSKGTQ